MYKMVVLGLILFGIQTKIIAQNLIPNPGFEEMQQCPVYLGNLSEDAKIWKAPTQGSTDYFNLCSPTMGTPENFNGKQTPYEGEAYAGFYAYAPDDYREYLQIPLAKNLEKGRSYECSFYISLAEGSDYAINKFGLLFSKDTLQVPIKKNLARRHWYKQPSNEFHYLEADYKYFYKDTRQWIRVSINFEARGMEKILTLGNFKSNRETRKSQTKRRAWKGAYYYIDDVRLIDTSGLGPLTAEPDMAADDPFELNALHAFSNLLFEFDAFELSESGQQEVNDLGTYLLQHPEIRIQIEGHTDNVGSEMYNQELSQNRCLSVEHHLQNMGIERSRIKWKAFGASRPVSENSTAEGRSRNRRVAFTLTRSNEMD